MSHGHLYKGVINSLHTIIINKQWDGSKGFFIKKISIFVGHISTDIKKEFTQFNKHLDGKFKSKILDDYFGKGFVDVINNLLSKKGGGNGVNNMWYGGADIDDPEINISDLFTDTMPSESALTDNVADIAEIDNPLLKKQSTMEISIMDILNAVKETTELKKEKEKKAELQAKQLNTSRPEPIISIDKIQLEIIEQNIWSIDTPMDLKKKIWTYMGIPIFCQHLTTADSAGNIIPLYYNIYNNNKLVRLNLENSFNIVDKYNGIPIYNTYYTYRDYFFIQTNDTFEIMDKFNGMTGLNGIVLTLYDARDFLNNISLKQIEKDKNIQQMIYYGFFILFFPIINDDIYQEYINTSGNLTEIAKVMPDILPKRTYLENIYENQYKIFNLFYTLTEIPTTDDKKILKDIEKDFYVHISETTIMNYEYGDSKLSILSLRNLFDKFKLSDQIVAIKYNALYENHILELHKTYKSNREITIKLPINSLVIKCILAENVLDKDTKLKATMYSEFDVFFYENGNYMVKCLWSDGVHHDFNEGIGVVAEFVNNKIIKQINHFKGNVIHSLYKLSYIESNNVQYSNIKAELYYRKKLTPEATYLLRYILRDFYEAGLLNVDLSGESNNYRYTYYLSKGNHQQDKAILYKKYVSLSNTYDYLTKQGVSSKWEQIYLHNKHIYVELRSSDINFSLSGLWDKEFNIGYSYILLALYIMHVNTIKQSPKYKELLSKDVKNIKVRETTNIKALKQIDPVLYDFKRYGSDIVYAKICQKPNQPQILTLEQYKGLSDTEKKKVLKYWNYTTGNDAYYYAPNPKYPYINFIVGKHPMNYCIPCAKKTPFENKSNVKSQIYKTCLDSHKYESGRKNIITETRYIMNYGKPIDAGRLCKLPENTIEPFLYESFYDNAGFDEECYQSDKYFIIGIGQEYNGRQSIGILNCISLLLDMPINKFLQTTKKYISERPELFSILLNGNILHDFFDYKEFNQIITDRFMTTNVLMDEYWETINWTGIFIDILFYYYNVIIIEFIDKYDKYIKKEVAQSNGTKKIRMVTEEKVAGDYVEIQINHKLDVILLDENIGAMYKYAMLIQKDNNVYPICFANPIVYFKTKIIGKKTFERSDHLIEIFYNFLSYIKQNDTSHLSDDYTHEIEPSFFSSYTAIDKFIKHNKSYSIFTYYVNKYNKCYYIGIGKEKKANIYIPVLLSDWVPSKSIEVKYEPYTYKGKMNFVDFTKFLSEYNKWIAGYAGDNMIIQPHRWISNTNHKIFGFIFRSINYYFNDINENEALNYKKCPIWVMQYDINDINMQIYKKAPIKSDPAIEHISASFYNNHLYQLLLLEFTNTLINEKNETLRSELKKNILNYGKIELVEIFEKLKKIIHNYYEEQRQSIDVKHKDLLKSDSENEDAINMWNELEDMDYIAILNIINNGITNFMDKSNIILQIDHAIFNFDKVAIHKFKIMPKDKLRSELLKIAKTITVNGAPPKVKDVPNILISCGQGDSYYCNNTKKKLIILNKDLEKMIDIMVADIKNPMKESWIFSTIFQDNIINFLKFEARPNEQIDVYMP